MSAVRDEKLRKTGRTTRMLQEAISFAKQGRAVYVIAGSADHRNQLEKRISDLCYGLTNLGIKVEYPAPHNFDWDYLRLKGAHPNCVVLIDHHTIERRYAAILHELHRYDPNV